MQEIVRWRAATILIVSGLIVFIYDPLVRMGKGDRKRFGKKIRQLRLAKGLTQEALAELAGLQPTYVGGIERGERNLGFDNIIKIARALGEHPSSLFVR